MGSGTKKSGILTGFGTALLFVILYFS